MEYKTSPFKSAETRGCSIMNTDGEGILARKEGRKKRRQTEGEKEGIKVEEKGFNFNSS